MRAVIVTTNPIPSLVMLHRHYDGSSSPTPLHSLSVRANSFRTTTVDHNVSDKHTSHPVARSLLLSAISTLNTGLRHIRVIHTRPPIFCTAIIILTSNGRREISTHPDSTVTLTMHDGTPVFIRSSVVGHLNAISPRTRRISGRRRFRGFSRFIRALSPSSFWVLNGRTVRYALVGTKISTRTTTVTHRTRVHSRTSRTTHVTCIARTHALHRHHNSFVGVIIVSTLITTVYSHLHNAINTLKFSVSANLIV